MLLSRRTAAAKRGSKSRTAPATSIGCCRHVERRQRLFGPDCQDPSLRRGFSALKEKVEVTPYGIGQYMAERPLGITILGALWIIGGLILLSGGLTVALVGGAAVGSWGWILGIIFMLWGILELAIGVGSFMGWPWVWIVSVVLAILSLVQAVYRDLHAGVDVPALRAHRRDHPLLPLPAGREGLVRARLNSLIFRRFAARPVLSGGVARQAGSSTVIVCAPARDGAPQQLSSDMARPRW